MLEFNQDRLLGRILYENKPVINITNITIRTQDKTWANRFFNGLLIIKISSFDQNDNELSSVSTPLSLGSFITPYIKEPLLEVNKYYKATDSLLGNIPAAHWTISIELQNFQFLPGEDLLLNSMDTNYIIERITNWRERIGDVYSKIKQWANEIGLITKAGQDVTMDEEMMRTFSVEPVRIPTIDVWNGKKMLLSFKPKGLWLLGANGAIDVLSENGLFVLADSAERFNPAQWYIVRRDKIKSKMDFSKEIFLTLLNL